MRYRSDGVEELRKHGKAAHAVDEGVMDFYDEDGPIDVRLLDEDGFPQRQRSVESACGHSLGHVDDVPEDPVFGQPHAAEMHVQVKVSSSTNCGRPRPGARVTARERRRGTASVSPATRAPDLCPVRLPSKTMRATMVGRMTGSELIVHSRASEPLMVSTALEPSLPLPSRNPPSPSNSLIGASHGA